MTDLRPADICILLLCFLLVSCSPQPYPSQLDIRHLIAPPSPPPTNRLLFTGDVMLSRGVRRTILAANDPALPLRKIAPLLAAADITFVNLESPFSDHAPYHADGLVFHAPPNTIAGLLLAGVDIASTANNHARDCGPHGVEYTVDWLRSHSIAPLGSAESAAQTHAGIILTRHDVRFGFLGYTFDQKNGNWRDIDDRIAVTDIPVMGNDVRSLRKRCDVVIVSMHNGVEYAAKPNRSQIDFAHAAIDAGAVLVVGHHPHVIEPMEVYKSGIIFYSLGNFVFDQYQRVATRHGEIAEVYFLGPQIAAAETLPIKITPTGPELESRPE